MLTQRERAERRRAIAEACKTQPATEVAKAFDVSLSQVRLSCRENAVVSVRGRPTSLRTLELLRLLVEGRGQHEIAREFNVSPRWVNQLARDAADCGWTIPSMRDK